MIFTFPIHNIQKTIKKIEILVKFIILKFHKSLKYILATFENLSEIFNVDEVKRYKSIGKVWKRYSSVATFNYSDFCSEILIFQSFLTLLASLELHMYVMMQRT